MMLRVRPLAKQLYQAHRVQATVAVGAARAFHSSPYVQASGKILLSDPIDPCCKEILENGGFKVDAKKLSKEELLQAIPEYDGIIVRSGTTVTSEVIKAGKKLKLIGRAGTGVDNIDVAEATRRGVVVMNTPGGNTYSAAELTMSMMLALARNIPQAAASMRDGKWDRKGFMGTELAGKTVGIVGLGRIGREVARWCQGFGMTTIGYDPVLSPAVAREAGIESTTLDQIYARSDFITLHTPLTSETRDLLRKETFAQCKDGVRIINCARGGIVNEYDLLEALESGKCAGAALDVFAVEPPPPELTALVQHPKVICTPHLGASTGEAQEKVAREIATQFVNAMDKGKYAGVVNAQHIGSAQSPAVRPFLQLGEQIGALQGQLINGAVKRVTIIAEGKELSNQTNSKVTVMSVLQGILNQLMDQPVNLVNADYLAKELGLKVEVTRRPESQSSYSNLLTVETQTEEGSLRLSATIFDDGVRVVGFDNFHVDLRPEGAMIFFRNQDKPGVLADVTRTLAAHNINIADFALGRSELGGSALGVISLDTLPSKDVMEQLKTLPNMLFVRGAQALAFDSDADDQKPSSKPKVPNFGSGPCTKRPGYALENLDTAALGRSHRSALGKSKLKAAIEETRRILSIPSNYHVGIVPASDTGAVEMSMWSLLGSRPVEVVFWESFGKTWWSDVQSQLKLKSAKKHESAYGELPDLSKVDTVNSDVIFTWNGTTSGVRVPNGDWISSNRQGLVICDATSGIFANELPWDKLDVTTFSWQKVLGGEGAHGMVILSPRAVQRLESYTPEWPLPKIFRMTKGGKLMKDLFEGSVINTPSMLCVEDYLDALNWSEDVGGLKGLIKRADENASVIEEFVKENDWIHFLAKDPAIRSNTSVCLTVDLAPEKVKEMVKLLENERVAYDIGAYRDAPAGLRIWCGATIEASDLRKLMPWIKYAYQTVQQS